MLLPALHVLACEHVVEVGTAQTEDLVGIDGLALDHELHVRQDVVVDVSLQIEQLTWHDIER